MRAYSLRVIVFGGTVIYMPPQVVTFLYVQLYKIRRKNASRDLYTEKIKEEKRTAFLLREWENELRRVISIPEENLVISFRFGFSGKVYREKKKRESCTRCIHHIRSLATPYFYFF